MRITKTHLKKCSTLEQRNRGKFWLLQLQAGYAKSKKAVTVYHPQTICLD